MSAETPVTVVGEVLPNRQDPSSLARFANDSRAEQYAVMLQGTGDYYQVLISYEGGKTYALTRLGDTIEVTA